MPKSFIMQKAGRGSPVGSVTETTKALLEVAHHQEDRHDRANDGLLLDRGLPTVSRKRWWMRGVRL